MPPTTAADPTDRPLLLLAGAPLLRWRGRVWPLAPVDAALLAWLAIEGPTGRGRVAELLWPDSAAAAARNTLRQRLYKLRRQFGVDLVAGHDTLALADGVVHDLGSADRLLAGTLVEAGGEFAIWLERQRTQQRARARQALVERADGAERDGDWPAALEQATELLAAEPHSEAAHRRLMRLHYLAGDRAAALLAFDRCEAMLKHEVGAAPSAETLALLQTIEAARLAPAPLRSVPASVLRPPRLIGRADAWAALEAGWAARRPLLLSGEAGLGKTRLAGDFAAAHGAVMAGARPGDERIAYASLSRLLRRLPRQRLDGLLPAQRRELARLLPELGDAPPTAIGEPARTRFYNAVGGLFDGTAVVFDDLHFADDASVELLQYIIAAAPGRWLLTARGAEAPPAARALLQDWTASSDVDHVPLGPLTLAQVVELLQSLALPGVDAEQAAPALLKRSGGNPLFLLETLKAGVGPAAGGLPAPIGVQALIERRITKLSLPAVQLARCAALAAPDFSIELAAHVLALRTIDLADPWAELEAAHVLADGAFAHDLIFEAARASVPAPVARQLHAEIAAFLAARGGEPARLAEHWTRAERWAQAGDAWRDAAERAHAAGRLLDAAALLSSAAQAFGRAGRTESRFDALRERAWLLAIEHHGDAVAAVAEVKPLAADDRQRLQVLEVEVVLSLHNGDSETTIALGEQGLALARQHGRDDLALQLAINVAGALCDLRRAAEAVALLEPLAAQVHEKATAEAQWGYWCGLALSLDYANRLRDAMPAWGRSRDVAQAAGRDDLLWKSMANAASTLAKTGFVRQATEQTAGAMALAEAIGESTPRLLQTRATWGHRLRDSGRLAEALPLLEGVLQHFAGGGAGDRASTEHRLAQLYQQLGQPQRALPLLAEDRAGLSPGLQTMRLVHRADIAHDLGRDGLPTMRQALALIANPDDIYQRIASLFATRLVPPDEGEALATSLAAWASARERLGVALAGHVRAAACALRQSAPLRARPHAEAALHLAIDRQPDSFYLGELWLVAGQVEAACGDRAAAQRHWQAGLAWARGLAVPEPFHDSFWHRNRINAELLRLTAA